MRSTPVLPDVGVISLSPVRWGGVWRPSNYVGQALSRYFRVVWVDPGVEWRAALRGLGPRSLQADVMPSDLIVHRAEKWLPIVNRPASIGEALQVARIRRARGRLVRMGCRKIVLYLWRPDFAFALSKVPHDASFYHIDDEYTFADDDVPVEAAEFTVLKSVDGVFIHSPGLLQKKGGINPNTHFTPNGVNFAALVAPRLEPGDMRHIPRPRIGYTGYLKKHLDFALLEALAEDHPNWQFVLVGGREDHPEISAPVERLTRHPNVHLLGEKPTRDILAYPQHFDVCIMPYRVMGYTSFIYPLKLHEYLATGHPVIATPIRSLQAFSAVVSLAHGPAEWSSAIAAALTPDEQASARREARRAVARQHDWDAIVEPIARTIAAQVGEDFSGRVKSGGRGHMTEPSGGRLGSSGKDAAGATERCRRRVLYIHPGNVPPQWPPERNAMYHVAQLLDGDLVMLSWDDRSSHGKHRERYRAALGGFGYSPCLRSRLPFPFRAVSQFLCMALRAVWLSIRKGRYDAIVAYGPSSTAWAGLVVKALTGAPLIVEIPGHPFKGFTYDASRFSKFKARIVRTMVPVVVRFSDALHLLYAEQARLFTDMEVPRTAVFADFVATSQVPDTGGRGDYILFLGYPWKLKGVDVLIRAFNEIAPRYPDVKLKVVGHCQERQEYERLAAGNPQVELCEAVPNAEAMELMSRCRFFVLPSRTEAMGRVIIEAWAAGKAVIASNVDGIPHLVRDGTDGLLFPSEDHRELARLMARLLCNPEEAEALALAGRERATVQFSESRYAVQFSEMVEQVAAPSA